MTDNNLIDLTNEDIISSLKLIATTRNCNECKIRNCKWGTCNCEQITANAALDFITRQQAELDNLKVENQSLRTAGNSLKMHYEEAQAEIERLKECPKCVYEYDGEIMEYCVQSPCSNFKTVEQVKAEAYKECLAKVKNYIKTHCNPYGKPDFDYDTSIKILNFIDNLVKGMAGEEE